MNKAIFLDRDGVINKEKGVWIYRSFDFEINPDIPQSLRLLKESGFIFIVITNQSGIAKGVYTHDDVIEVHKFMTDLLKMEGVALTDIFYCPHHDEVGRCLCRKPGSLMLEKAIAIHDIEAKKSFMIGDKQRDIDAATSAGVKGILINSNDPIFSIARKIKNGEAVPAY